MPEKMKRPAGPISRGEIDSVMLFPWITRGMRDEFKASNPDMPATAENIHSYFKFCDPVIADHWQHSHQQDSLQLTCRVFMSIAADHAAASSAAMSGVCGIDYSRTRSESPANRDEQILRHMERRDRAERDYKRLAAVLEYLSPALEHAD